MLVVHFQKRKNHRFLSNRYGVIIGGSHETIECSVGRVVANLRSAGKRTVDSNRAVYRNQYYCNGSDDDLACRFIKLDPNLRYGMGCTRKFGRRVRTGIWN